MRLQLAYWQLGGGKAINEIKIQLLLLLPFCYSSANSDIGRRRRQQTLPMNFSIQVGRNKTGVFRPAAFNRRRLWRQRIIFPKPPAGKLLTFFLSPVRSLAELAGHFYRRTPISVSV